MVPNEFLSSYSSRLIEYGLGAGYLALFVPFWRYLGAGRGAGRVAPARAEAATAPANAGWFHLPADVLLHPGHTWARQGADGLVEVGVDDFAARLIGPVGSLRLPEPGAQLVQGAPAVVAEDGGRAVALVSPVHGVVAEVNRGALEGDRWLHQPYAGGWLCKVAPARFADDREQLLAGERARRWVEQASQALARRLSPQLGALVHDGGTPVHGIARELEPERWDELCRDAFQG